MRDQGPICGIKAPYARPRPHMRDQGPICGIKAPYTDQGPIHELYIYLYMKVLEMAHMRDQGPIYGMKEAYT